MNVCWWFSPRWRVGKQKRQQFEQVAPVAGDELEMEVVVGHNRVTMPRSADQRSHEAGIGVVVWASLVVVLVVVGGIVIIIIAVVVVVLEVVIIMDVVFVVLVLEDQVMCIVVFQLRLDEIVWTQGFDSPYHIPCRTSEEHLAILWRVGPGQIATLAVDE